MCSILLFRYLTVIASCLSVCMRVRAMIWRCDSCRCSCTLEEGYRYYIGGPATALECGLSLCVYLQRHSEQVLTRQIPSHFIGD